MTQLNPKITALEWKSSGSGETIVACISFDNFKQSCRFVEMMTAYVLKERDENKVTPSCGCVFCDIKVPLHEDATGFHHVVDGEGIPCGRAKPTDIGNVT